MKASLAAGSIVIPRERRRGRLLIAAVPVHLSLSAAWAVTLAALLPRRHPLGEGALAGLAIAAFDLGIIGRRYPLVRELQPLPQIADHIAFGIIVSVLLSRSLGAAR